VWDVVTEEVIPQRPNDDMFYVPVREGFDSPACVGSTIARLVSYFQYSFANSPDGRPDRIALDTAIQMGGTEITVLAFLMRLRERTYAAFFPTSLFFNQELTHEFNLDAIVNVAGIAHVCLEFMFEGEIHQE
jgi:hypothetical protein